MDIMKGEVMSYCNIDQDINHQAGLGRLTIDENPTHLIPQNCLDQQNNMNQQNCMDPQNSIVQPNLPSHNLCMHAKPISKSSSANNDGDSKQSSKKTKKVKTNKSQWRKEKGNKYLNKPYRNYKGIEIKSKEFVDYDCHCTMKCKEMLSAKDRKHEFQKFWELGSYEAQAIFLIARVDEQTTKKSVKEKKKDNDDDKSDDSSSSDRKKSKRQFSRRYILRCKQVCRDMFVKTLGITSKRINTALVKMRSKSLVDHRGLSQGGKNKISEDRYDEVVQHIKKMPRYKCCHMQDKHDNDFMNLPPELSLSKMYELYVKEVEHPVSMSMYKKIYYGKFNFQTKGVKREICSTCKGDRKMKNAELKKQQIMEKLSMHCPNNQMMMQEQYIIPTAVPQPPMNCNQPWFPVQNFQVPQHNPAHYFDQPVAYDMN